MHLLPTQNLVLQSNISGCITLGNGLKKVPKPANPMSVDSEDITHIVYLAKSDVHSSIPKQFTLSCEVKMFHANGINGV